MRNTLFLFSLLMGINIYTPAKSQILSPVKWSYAARRLNKKEAMLFLKATIEPGWHIYSTTQREGGPVKTSFTFGASKDCALVGVIDEPEPVTKYEKVFAMNVSYFENSVIFRQKVKLNKPSATVKGTLKFMVCNDQKCLSPEDVGFSIPIK